MNKSERIIILLLISIVLYLQSVLSLLLYGYVSWFWLDEYVWISAACASFLLIFAIIEAKLGSK